MCSQDRSDVSTSFSGLTKDFTNAVVIMLDAVHIVWANNAYISKNNDVNSSEK